MYFTRRTFLARAAALAAASYLLAPGFAAAQAFPTKPITLVVPFAPGGNIDVAARTVSVPLGKLLGQQVIVENRTGASGAIAAAFVARSAADGHTLFVGNPGQVTTVPLLIKSGYTPASFKPVGLISKTSLVLIGRKGDPHFANFAQFRAYASSKPAAVNAANPGQGTPNHLGLLMLEKVGNMKFNSIAYRGSAPALTDLVGGQIDVHFDQVTSSLPFIKSGALQPLAIMGPARDPALPEVPTLDQLGVHGIDATTYVGVFAPAGVPADVLAKLGAALRQAAQSPELAAALSQLGSQAYAGSSDDLGRIVAAEGTTAAQLIKDGRLTNE